MSNLRHWLVDKKWKTSSTRFAHLATSAEFQGIKTLLAGFKTRRRSSGATGETPVATVGVGWCVFPDERGSVSKNVAKAL